MKPIAILTKDREAAFRFLYHNLVTVSIKDNIAETLHTKFIVITEAEQLMSIHISGFIVLDDTVDADMLHWAFTQVR